MRASWYRSAAVAWSHRLYLGNLARTAAGSELMTNVYVGNLPYNIDDEQLAQIFQEHGAVSSAKVVMDRETGRSRGFGFVEMANEDEASAAIEALNGTDMGGRKLVVNEARPKR